MKYSYMEETVGNIPGARAIFERWMEWEPEDQYWSTYVNFELRYKELERARRIFERFVMIHPDVKNWIRSVLKIMGQKFNSIFPLQKIYIFLFLDFQNSLKNHFLHNSDYTLML